MRAIFFIRTVDQKKSFGFYDILRHFRKFYFLLPQVIKRNFKKLHTNYVWYQNQCKNINAYICKYLTHKCEYQHHSQDSKINILSNNTTWSLLSLKLYVSVITWIYTDYLTINTYKQISTKFQDPGTTHYLSTLMQKCYILFKKNVISKIEIISNIQYA